MPSLSNGSELTVWEDLDNQSPDAVLFTITASNGDVLGPVGARADYPFGSIEVASIDVFDGFFTITTFTHDGRTKVATTIETLVFDNEGSYIRSLSDQAAYLSAQIVSVTAESPDDITVTWIGANQYFGGENTQYGQHQIILRDGALHLDSFVNHVPVATDMNFTLLPGQSLDDVAFSAADADFDLLAFIVVEGPAHGTLEQETRYESGYYPFPQGEYGGSLHFHQDFLSGNLFDYTPEAGFLGTDRFTIYVTDGQGNSNLATITITVTPPAQSIILTDAAEKISYQAYDHPVLVVAAGGNDRIAGSRFDDTLEDMAGNDRLNGGAGNDILSGGVGRDKLIGGEGADTFLFDVAPDTASCDRVLDFCAADDLFRLDAAVFAALSVGTLDSETLAFGKAASDEDDRIVYDQARGELFYDADGTGGADAVRFAIVSRGTSLAAEDFLVF
ncbi:MULTISPECIES: Ig-like domain-containing protein [Sinorhizobium]|uniref:Calcium-binding protein n=1 Tax=Sinorhizobium americanum TaxID=194963 RepID=A0A2S3YMZ5_9HYPH|nr:MULTISPECIES: Ig-like domain-containing protein [Sinorhizobium]PDT42526.1 calcium-binding protein [Sinorhizobium sp. FG01]POH30443.1 calcium-binding protein [Sinorhizobium americanum]